MLHGDAVAIGMVVEADIAELLGVAEIGLATHVRIAVRAAGLPHRVPTGLSVSAIVAATYGDKKSRAGQPHYALPARIGAMSPGDGRWSTPVPDAIATDALNAHIG